MAVLLEACLDSVELAKAAEFGGAGRIELCDRLDIGGTTPADDLIRAVTAAVRIPVFVIVRPRGGDFLYSEAEIEAMKRDAGRLRRLGAAGLVTGVLSPDSTVDARRTREVVEAGGGLPATFHLAFEHVPDRHTALETLIDIGVERLLTSGGEARTAVDGVEGIRRLVDQAVGRIEIMAGGGVREQNVADIVRLTGVREVHSRGVAVAAMVAAANHPA